MSTLKVINLVHPSGGSNTVSMDTNGNLTVTGSVVGGSAMSGMRNRIINGDMRIDQRNAGASGTALSYTVDRWVYQASQASKGTWGQNLNSVTGPTGFTKYLGFQTGASGYAVLSSDYFDFYQVIEGYNTADLAWGTSSAKTVTLSFWVYSSLTGTFGASIRNSTFGRSYPFSYTISAANTWTYVSITVPGDTSGTWATDNTGSLLITFSLGMGSTYSGGGLAWTSSNYASPSGTVNVVGTANATFYVTGVQLEAGTAATPFERRMYGAELALCQRYYQLIDNGVGKAAQTGVLQFNANFIVEMRSAPTFTATTMRITDCNIQDFQAASPSPSAANINIRGGRVEVTGFSGLTAGSTYLIMPTGTSAAPIKASAEL